MVTLEHEKWRKLCRQAIIENDIDKLLKIFIELDRATEREQRRRRSSKRRDSASTSDLERYPGIE
jgi:hypothetical protein